MRIYDLAKELTKKTTGKQVTANEIIRILSKKKDGLRMTSEISPELEAYATKIILGEIPDNAEKKKTTMTAPAAKKPVKKTASSAEKKAPAEAPKKTKTPGMAKKSAEPRPGEGPKSAPTGLIKKKVVKKVVVKAEPEKAPEEKAAPAPAPEVKEAPVEENSVEAGISKLLSDIRDGE